jgi:hypothetical protein
MIIQTIENLGTPKTVRVSGLLSIVVVVFHSAHYNGFPRLLGLGQQA